MHDRQTGFRDRCDRIEGRARIMPSWVACSIHPLRGGGLDDGTQRPTRGRFGQSGVPQIIHEHGCGAP